MLVIVQAVLLAVQTVLVVWSPTPFTIGGLIAVAACFVFCLVMEAQRDR